MALVKRCTDRFAQADALAALAKVAGCARVAVVATKPFVYGLRVAGSVGRIADANRALFAHVRTVSRRSGDARKVCRVACLRAVACVAVVAVCIDNAFAGGVGSVCAAGCRGARVDGTRVAVVAIERTAGNAPLRLVAQLVPIADVAVPAHKRCSGNTSLLQAAGFRSIADIPIIALESLAALADTVCTLIIFCTCVAIVAGGCVVHRCTAGHGVAAVIRTNIPVVALECVANTCVRVSARVVLCTCVIVVAECSVRTPHLDACAVLA